MKEIALVVVVTVDDAILIDSMWYPYWNLYKDYPKADKANREMLAKITEVEEILLYI